jgi:predicted nucleic-acid-binding Zn-ribbon protein
MGRPGTSRDFDRPIRIREEVMAVCVKCASKDIIDEAEIIDTGQYSYESTLSARIYRNPGGFVFPGRVNSTILSRICGSCGYVELYLQNPRAFLEVAKGARARKRRKKWTIRGNPALFLSW